MWYEMDRSLFIDLAYVQDLLSFCVTHKIKAVKADNMLTTRVIKILIANGITVYDVRAAEKENNRPDPGHYMSGKKDAVKLIDLQIEAPLVTGRNIDYKSITAKLDYLKGAKGLTIAYFYIHPELLKYKFKVFPSFRAHSGLILVSNLPVKEVNLDIFISRFYEANFVRNIFPYSRISFAPLDPFFSYFRTSIAIPRNIPRANQPENVVDVKIIPIKERAEFELDSALVEQVAMKVTEDDAYRAFYNDVCGFTDDIRYMELRAMYFFPKFPISTFTFNYLKSHYPTYSLRTDVDLRGKYPDLFRMFETEERTVPDPSDVVANDNEGDVDGDSITIDNGVDVADAEDIDFFGSDSVSKKLVKVIL